MSDTATQTAHRHPPLGQLGYVQLPAVDLPRSAAFYEQVFGWKVELTYGSFEAPGVIGQWTTDLAPSTGSGPRLWFCADRLWPTLDQVASLGGAVVDSPQLDQGERWLVEIDDPAGNRIGMVVPAVKAQPQTMIGVQDVEKASRWYQQLLGFRSDHGGPAYERLLSDGVLVLQLHQQDVEHDHGRITDAAGADPQETASPGLGRGVLLWFGEVADFDDVVARAEQMSVTVVKPIHRNPPSGQGNGPGHREIWLQDLDGYVVVVASPDGEAFERP
ncbi:MAG: VOC family protein [Propionibacteriaceae bacterium]